MTITLHYLQLSVLRVLIDHGANINQAVNTGYCRQNPPVTIVCFEEGFPLLKLMVAAGADVESCDWNGLISWTFGYNSDDFIKAMLILLTQAGNKVNAKTLICCIQDIHDHRGGCGRPVSVPEVLQLYQDGKLYQESIMDKCRLVIRRKLITHAQGRSIFPAIGRLQISEKLKKFLAYDCLDDGLV